MATTLPSPDTWVPNQSKTSLVVNLLLYNHVSVNEDSIIYTSPLADKPPQTQLGSLEHQPALHCHLLWYKREARREAVGGFDEPAHLIGLSHVAVEDPSHALNGRVLQLVGAAHVVVDAPVAQRERR